MEIIGLGKFGVFTRPQHFCIKLTAQAKINPATWGANGQEDK